MVRRLGSAGGSLHDPHNILGPVVRTGTYLDEVGRTRDAGTDAIIKPGHRRVPPAADMTYVERLERHNAQLDAENKELRVANGSLKSAKSSLSSRVADLEKDRAMLLEEMDRLRAAVAYTADQSRHFEIDNMFLHHDKDRLQDTIKLMSDANAVRAGAVTGVPHDPGAGTLYVPGPNIQNQAQAAEWKKKIEQNHIPALPTTPYERAQYPAELRVICLLAKVNIFATDGDVTFDKAAPEKCGAVRLQAALDGQDVAAVKDKVQNELGDTGKKFDAFVQQCATNSSATLARAEKELGLTTVHYNPFIYDPIGS